MDKLCGRINVYILDIPGILVYVAFDIALKILWTERFGLEGLHQLYTPEVYRNQCNNSIIYIIMTKNNAIQKMIVTMEKSQSGNIWDPD